MLIIFYYQGKKRSITEYDCQSWKAIEPISFENLSEPMCMLRPGPHKGMRLEPGLEFQFPGSSGVYGSGTKAKIVCLECFICAAADEKYLSSMVQCLQKH